MRSEFNAGYLWITTGAICWIILIFIGYKWGVEHAINYVKTLMASISTSYGIIAIFLSSMIEATYVIGSVLAGSLFIVITIWAADTLWRLLEIWCFMNVGALAGYSVSYMIGIMISNKNFGVMRQPSFLESLHPNFLATYCVEQGMTRSGYARAVGAAVGRTLVMTAFFVPTIHVVAGRIIKSASETPEVVPIVMIALGCYKIIREWYLRKWG